MQQRRVVPARVIGLNWRGGLSSMGSPSQIMLSSIIIFPGLALGLSGFETGVSVMPLIRGEGHDVRPPVRRIRNTNKLLISAAVLMCVLLMDLQPDDDTADCTGRLSG